MVLLQILLYEARTHVDIDLDEGRVTNAPEGVDLPGLDDENVARSGLELHAVDGPEASAFPDELDFVVRMPMGPGTFPGEGAEQEYGDLHVAVIGADKVMGASLER